jgi:NADH-quinone oxidoreductase subunit A
MTPLAAYLLLFLAVGVGFIFVHLVVGKLIRPAKPDAEKGTIYECGEPTIGSAWVQFDLRFYVVALLFVIFDVEVAFFFPWAVVFGRANELAAAGPLDNAEAYHKVAQEAASLIPPYQQATADLRLSRMRAMTPQDVERLKELKEKLKQILANDPLKNLPNDEREELAALSDIESQALALQKEARSLGWMAFWEILVFFGVLLVGFAYLWSRGDLAWVRSLSDRRPAATPIPPSPLAARNELVSAGR